MGRFKTSRRSITGRRAKGTDRPTPAGAGITEKETTMLLKLNLRTGELVEDQSDTAAPTAVEVEGLARIKRALSFGALTVDDLIPDSLLADDAADAGKPNRGNGTMTTELHDEHVKEWKRHQAAKAAPMRDVQNHIKMYSTAPSISTSTQEPNPTRRTLRSAGLQRACKSGVLTMTAISWPSTFSGRRSRMKVAVRQTDLRAMDKKGAAVRGSLESHPRAGHWRPDHALVIEKIRWLYSC